MYIISVLIFVSVGQVVYWSDVLSHAIYRAPLDGSTEKEVFLNSTHGIGIVDGSSFFYNFRCFSGKRQNSTKNSTAFPKIADLKKISAVHTCTTVPEISLKGIRNSAIKVIGVQ